MDPLRILVIATKTPWPPIDGGRVVLLNTIEALADAGHHIDLVAPCGDAPDAISDALEPICRPHLVPVRPRSAFAAALRALTAGVPVTVARHTITGLKRIVDEITAAGGVDVIHAEQLHTLPQASGALRAGIPVVHRAHNVESMLWAYAAGHRNPVLRSMLAFEARRMSACEAEALDSAACTVALSEPDRAAFSELVPGAVVHTVRAPYPGDAAADPSPLPGDPAVVTLTSPTWAPSRDAVDRLAVEIWPSVRRRLSGAVLHVFGGGHHLDGLDGVVPRPPPDNSRSAFPTKAIVVIPERHPTGVPLKALEAWARGLPLIVDEPTADILEAADGGELLVATGADGYADALVRLHGDPSLRDRLVQEGRRALRQRHDPAAIAHHLERIYRWAISRTQ